MTRHKVDPEAAPEIAAEDLASWVLAWLDREGATVTFDANDRFLFDLNAIHGMTQAQADRLARVILGLRDELRVLLLDRLATRTVQTASGVH